MFPFHLMTGHQAVRCVGSSETCAPTPLAMLAIPHTLLQLLTSESGTTRPSFAVQQFRLLRTVEADVSAADSVAGAVRASLSRARRHPRSHGCGWRPNFVRG